MPFKVRSCLLLISLKPLRAGPFAHFSGLLPHNRGVLGGLCEFRAPGARLLVVTKLMWHFRERVNRAARREVRVEMRIWRGGGREGIIDRTECSRRLYWGRLIVGYLLFRSERKSGYQGGYQIRKP